LSDRIKILAVNQSDLDGGAARAAYRIASKQIAMGADVTLQVMRMLGEDPWVVGPRSRFQKIVTRLLPRLEQLGKKKAGVRSEFPWSLNAFPNPQWNAAFVNGFDVVHLHWVGKNMLPVRWMPHFQKPLVWTLHDSWPFTGGCHMPFDCRGFERSCGACPQLLDGSVSDASRHMWKEKKKAFAGLDLHFVAPSRWVADEARSSSLLSGRPVHVIPNGLDTSIFAPTDKMAARTALGLPLNKRILLFGAMYAYSDRRKGLHLLLEALEALRQQDPGFTQQTVLAIFGAGVQSAAKSLPIPVVELGFIRDDSKLALIYSAADITVVPSTMETFGQVASESLSCGTPVVAFKATGLQDVVDSTKTGYLAAPFDTRDLAHGIRSLLEPSDQNRKMGVTARQEAVSRFDIGTVAQAHLDLYERIAAPR
jgi:glycosyltransferase involved in cell wall biosynthesis